jgi:hypothetical protein
MLRPWWHEELCKYDILIPLSITLHYFINQIGGVIISEHSSSAVDHGFEPRSGHTKDYKIGICFFSAKHAALRRKSSEWSDMSSRGLLFQ